MSSSVSSIIVVIIHNHPFERFRSSNPTKLLCLNTKTSYTTEITAGSSLEEPNHAETFYLKKLNPYVGCLLPDIFLRLFENGSDVGW